MQFVRQTHRVAASRRGLTIPIVALALLITMAGMALILDRIWLETAQLELTTAAEATALAAARQLASDDRLIPQLDAAQRLDAARNAAEAIAEGNRVAGRIPSFSATGNDLLFGNYSLRQPDGSIDFIVAGDDPRTVRITLHRTRARNNPVALFIGDLTRIPFGDVRRQADATVDNHLAGIRPPRGGTAPALPLAIWKHDPTGNRTDTWTVQIDQRRGPDQYRYEASSNRPLLGSDDIPEISVRSVPRGGRPELCNLQVLDLGTNLDDDKLARQFRTGWSADDLQDFGGLLTLAGGKSFASSAELVAQDRDALESLLGEPRICLLFTTAIPANGSGLLQTTCGEFVAVRVMAVRDVSDGSCELILQPTVLATRAAVTTSVVGQPSADPPNKYIYNLQLTN